MREITYAQAGLEAVQEEMRRDGKVFYMSTDAIIPLVKEFGEVGAAIERAIAGYADEVRARTFPASEHTYAMKDEGGAKASGEAAGAAPASSRATKKSKNPGT